MSYDDELSPIDQVYNRNVATEKLKHGTKYERLTALVFQVLEAESTVTHDVTLRGDGLKSVHQIDVRVANGDRSRRTIIECRDKSGDNKIDLDQARSFATVVRHLGADGVMVTTTGFTQPAIDLAEDEGLQLLSLRAFTPEDMEGRLKSIRLRVLGAMPVPDEVSVSSPDGSTTVETRSVPMNAVVLAGSEAPTFRAVLESMMTFPLREPPSGEQNEGRTFDPPLVVDVDGEELRVDEIRVRYHVEVEEIVTTIDAGSKVAELVLRSLDGTFDRVIWDADLRQLGFDPVTGDVVARDGPEVK